MSTTTHAPTATTVEVLYATSAGTVETMRDNGAITAHILGIASAADLPIVLDAARALGIVGTPELFERYDDGAEGWAIYPE
jgi:hypothetical protein